MCLAVPGKVVSLSGDGLFRMATVDFGGVTKQISLALLEGVSEGEYVIVHAGVAIRKLNEEAALETLKAMEDA